MAAHDSIDRRGLGRMLSRIMDASVDEALAGLVDSSDNSARRVGFTGSPGAGKSTLISRYAKGCLEKGNKTGILAIDPTSPISGGALLGDRIRMDAVADDARLFIRSVPSRNAHDGLCDNAPDLLLAMEQFGFDDIVLETVGVGQVEYSVKTLVDTLVLVLMPESGDAIQAMKAGILESADIIVINKADLPGAERSHAEISVILGHRPRTDDTWPTQLIMASDIDGRGTGQLSDTIVQHQAWLATHRDHDDLRRKRRAYHLHSLITRRAHELMNQMGDDLVTQDLVTAFRQLASLIAPVDRA